MKREAILAKFTTNEKLTITFVSSGVLPPQAGGPNAPNSQVKTRLDQLDDFEEGSVQEMQGLTFQDWMKKFALHNARLGSHLCQSRRAVE